tara:strand:- start:751 stop:1875 length:1125 start_codon:yes stop_codon:yes gene_type:complete
MKKKLLVGAMIAASAMGASRAEHAANITMASNSWEHYQELHEETFAANGLVKMQILNAEGAVIARNSRVAEAVANKLYNNSTTLRHEDFLVIQEMITEVRRRKLNGINDLKEAGLTFPVSIGDQIVGTENINSFGDAEQEQNPTGYDNEDTAFTETYVPNPITHKTFGVPWRQQGFNYKSSAGLKESMRKVAERLEETLFNGNTAINVSFGGQLNPIYGYTTHPDRGTATISDWSNVINNDAIVNEVIANVGSMFANQGGVEMDSVILYFPKNFKEAMDRDYSSLKGDLTVAERIKKIPEIKDVKFGEKLADSNVVYVEMSDRTVQLAVASDIVSVPHVKTNPMASQFLTTYAAMVQIIKADSDGNTGILHATV